MMMRDKVYLVSTVANVNAIGDPVEAKTKTIVYAEIKSVRQSEFYQAAAAGLRPELMFIVRTDEYDNHSKLEYNDTEYTVIRVFNRPDKKTELTCQGLTNGVI